MNTSEGGRAGSIWGETTRCKTDVDGTCTDDI